MEQWRTTVRPGAVARAPRSDGSSMGPRHGRAVGRRGAETHTAPLSCSGTGAATEANTMGSHAHAHTTACGHSAGPWGNRGWHRWLRVAVALAVVLRSGAAWSRERAWKGRGGDAGAEHAAAAQRWRSSWNRAQEGNGRGTSPTRMTAGHRFAGRCSSGMPRNHRSARGRTGVEVERRCGTRAHGRESTGGSGAEWGGRHGDYGRRPGRCSAWKSRRRRR